MSEREAILGDVIDEVFGLGPLEPLLRDPTVSDILVNTYKHVYVERSGKLERAADDVPGRPPPDARHRPHRQRRRPARRRQLADGRRAPRRTARVSTPSSRRWRSTARCSRSAAFPPSGCKAEDLVTLRALTRPMLEFLQHCVRARLNTIISGGTGAGKTTLLNVLSSFISERERIVTIEDAAELQLHQEHVVRLETRPPNVEGKGAIRQRQLVINALRMRPDRIVVGEVRGDEALDMLQAMNTGHDGSLTTVHANTPRDALTPNRNDDRDGRR